MCNDRLNEAQGGIQIAGRNINNFSYTDDPTLVTESKEEPKSLFRKVEEENEKAGLKLNREGGGRGVQDGEHMYTHGVFKSMYGKTNTTL